jgi:hypothetical protein
VRSKNTTVVAITLAAGTPRIVLPPGTRHTLTFAPADRVPGASHCLYLPISGGGVDPQVGDVIELTPTGGALQLYEVLRVDQVPGRLGHRAVWLGPP